MIGGHDDDDDAGDEVGEEESSSDGNEKKTRPQKSPSLRTEVAAAPVRAHKAILAARCEVFRAMFTSGMKEASQQTVVLVSCLSDFVCRLLDVKFMLLWFE